MRTLVLVRTVLLVGVLAIVSPATARAGSISLDTRFQGQGLGIRNSAGVTIDAQDFIGPLAVTTPAPQPSAGLLLGMGAMSLAAFRSRKSFFRRS